MNGTMKPPSADWLDRVLKYVTAWLVFGGILAFMWSALVDPTTAAIPDAQAGIIFGGMISILTVVVNSLFQGAATREVARQLNTATQTAVNAALSSPPSDQIIEEPKA